jgi:galactokinase
MTAAALFRSRFAAEPVGVWSAPGRVNLIGEHTDYNDGLVLPFAIEARARIALGPAHDGRFAVVSAQRRGATVRVRPEDLLPGSPVTAGWAAYPLGVLWSLRQAGHTVPPLCLALDSAVPAGAGLSTSAAGECAVALAASEHLDLGLARPEIARIAQRAENDFVGVPCGLMDQMVASCCTPGHALFFDVGAGTTEQIPFDPLSAGLRTLVIDTRVHHALADGEYARRRADCEAAAVQLGVPSLSALHPGQLPDALARLSGPDAEVLGRRVRHVVTENQRVRAVTTLLRTGDPGDTAAIGPELTASHDSLREDYEVSCPELDVAVAAALSAGALGARMVGGGFGGSVIALAPVQAVDGVRSAVRNAFADNGFGEPAVRTVAPSEGARRDR